MTRKIFIWIAHPRAGSLNHGLATAYAEGARKAGASVRIQALSEMQFASEFTGYGEGQTSVEPDLEAWRDGLLWADHVVMVTPYWWGGLPARAKAVLERALTPGFAFKYRGKGLVWDKLLTGRTGDILITSDTPSFWDRWVYHMPGRRVLTKLVYEFVGIEPRQVKQFGAVVTSSPGKRRKWLNRSEKMGARAALG